MSCKYIPSYIDRRVFVSGKESILNTHNFVEFGILPRKGEANDVLIKCTSKDYHAKWDSLTNVISPLLPTLLTGLFTFQNGLTESPAFTVEWGGTLLRNTTINGANLYDVTFRFLDEFNVQTSVGDINMAAATDFFMGAVDTLTIQGQTSLEVMTPDVITKTVGAILQLQNNASGDVEYTPYILPLTDGINGQSLVTDGAGVVSWTSPTPQVHKCEVLEFTDNPTDIVNNVNGVGNLIIQNYTLPAGTLNSNGSYIDVEFSADITGTIPLIPSLYYNFDGKSFQFNYPIGGTYTQTIKARTYRVSNTSFFTHAKSEIFDPVTGEILTTYFKNYEDNLTMTFSDDTDLSIRIDRDLLSDYTVEIKHFSVTKFLK